MRLVKPASDAQSTPRGIFGGSEISRPRGATNIFMGRFQVLGRRVAPRDHENCESALDMLSGSIEIRWGDHLEETLVVEPGDLLYVPPRETSRRQPLGDEPAEYVVARDSPTKDWVEVPWASEG